MYTRPQTALATAQVPCTKTSKAVELAQKRINAAEKAKTKADKVHTTSFLQLNVLRQAVEAVNSLVTEAKQCKAPVQELETLTMKASIAENDKMNYAPQVARDASRNKGTTAGLTNRQAEVVPLFAVAAEADTAMQSAASQLQTATAAKEVALQALTKLGLKPRVDNAPVDDETGDDPPPAAPTAKEQQAARNAALKKYNKATADAKTAQTVLATAHAACIKTSKDVELARTKIKVSGRVKAKADKAHKAVVVQQDLLVKGVGDTQSQLTAAGQRTARKQLMDKLTTAASTAVADHQAFQTTVASSERAKRVAAASLTKFQQALVPLSEAAADANRDKQLARAQLETAI
jgi:hypothetical protein